MYLVGNVLSLFFCLSSGLFPFLLKEMFLDVCYVASRWVSWNFLVDSWILFEMMGEEGVVVSSCVASLV